MTLNECHLAITLITATGMFISAAEHLSNWPQLRTNGTYHWPLLRESWWQRTRFQTLNRFLEVIFSPAAFLSTLALQMAAVLFMVYSALSPADSVFLESLALGTVVVTNMGINYRNRIQLDGSDQMISIVVSALFFYSLFPDNELMKQITVWFIAIQACIAYVTSGLSKAAAAIEKGRSSDAGLAMVSVYGVDSLTLLARRSPKLSRALLWGLIGAQSSFPCALFIGYPGAILYLGWGVIFHFVNAILLGLNRFLWAFLATYPALLYCRAELYHTLME